MRTCPTCGRSLPVESNFCPYDGATLAAGDPLVDTVFDHRYRILAFLGESAAGRVYLARHTALDRDVALRLFADRIAKDERAIVRFAKEARAASAIDHENVASVIDYGRTEHHAFLAVEYVPGRRLDAEIAKGPFSSERAAHVLAQIAAGARRGHTLGVAHRDLRPSSVILRQQGSDPDFVKILDFGVGEREGDARSDLAALVAIGRSLTPDPHPELARCLGQEHKDVRSFLAALGEVWKALPPGTRRTTYAHSPAARPRPSGEALSAAESYARSAIDPMWDGPALVREVRRLHLLRNRRFAELARAIWPGSPPHEVATLLGKFAEIDESVDDTAEQIAIVETMLEESARAAREREARLRLELIDATLALTVFQGLGFMGESDDTEVFGREALDHTDGDPAQGPRVKQRQAERALATFYRRTAREEDELRVQLRVSVSKLRELEREMTPLVAEVADLLEREANARPDLRESLVALRKIEGAIFPYRALLDALQDDAAR